MQDPKNILNGSTLVPLGVISGLLAAAWSYGAMWQQVQGLQISMNQIQRQVATISDQLDGLNSKYSLANK
jgi:hypothetical protein